MYSCLNLTSPIMAPVIVIMMMVQPIIVHLIKPSPRGPVEPKRAHSMLFWMTAQSVRSETRFLDEAGVSASGFFNNSILQAWRETSAHRGAGTTVQKCIVFIICVDQHFVLHEDKGCHYWKCMNRSRSPRVNMSLSTKVLFCTLCFIVC